MLEAIAVPGEWAFSVLINFQLIASGEAFPYAELSKYDAIIYSPIENKEGYNTPALRAYCESIGCQTICFPWLEWHGYCPGALKGAFRGRHQWHYARLADLAAGFATFDRFVSHVTDAFPDDDTIDGTLEASTARLRASEVRHATDIKVADYIVDNFRSSRLFLISDHAGLALYLHLIDQIVDLLGLQTVSAWPSCEPQWQFRTPIMPRVARRLGLTFQDTQWADYQVLPDTSWDLQTYLALYYYADSLIMGPMDRAEILGRALSPDKTMFVNGNTRLLARPSATSRSDDLAEYVLLKDLADPLVSLAAGTSFCVKPNEWTTSWLA